jgi:hypothetical protein
MKSFIPLFDKEYAPHLNPKVNSNKKGLIDNVYQREPGFRKIFEMLELKNKSSYRIVETGSLRQPGDWRAGQSSILFQEFVKIHGGKVDSVDIDETVYKTATDFLDSAYSTVTLSDSVAFLENGDWNDVDLFYLDSYDVKWNKPEPSAEHHLKEFIAVEKYLKSGTIVAIDDNSFFAADNRRTGKGLMVYNYLKDKGILPLYDDYQIIYKF